MAQPLSPSKKRKSFDLDDDPISHISPEELKFECKLGAGGFGEVWKATWLKNGTQVAVKKLLKKDDAAKKPEEMEDFEHELEVLYKARHPNLLLLMGWNLSPHSMLLMTELMERGSLQTLLDRDVNGEFRWGAKGSSVALDVCSGLSFLHAQEIVHLDLKPDNILIDKYNRAKLGDVGMATRLKEEEVLGVMGTPGYMAPELFVGGVGANTQSDMFAFGVILGMLLAKDPKEYATTFRRNQVEIATTIHTRESVSVSDVTKDGVAVWVACPSPLSPCPSGMETLIKRCMRANPTERPTAKAFLDGGTLSSSGGTVKWEQGQVVVVKKKGSQYGNRAQILVSDWGGAGLMKVKMVTGPHAHTTAAIKSYWPSKGEIELFVESESAPKAGGVGGPMLFQPPQPASPRKKDSIVAPPPVPPSPGGSTRHVLWDLLNPKDREFLRKVLNDVDGFKIVPKVCRDKIEKIFVSHDRNGDGVLSAVDFSASFSHDPELASKMQAAWKDLLLFDDHPDGIITPAEFVGGFVAIALTKSGEIEPQDAEWQRVFVAQLDAAVSEWDDLHGGGGGGNGSGGGLGVGAGAGAGNKKAMHGT